VAAKFELYKSSNGEYRWRLKSSNGQVIATSGEGYTSKDGANNGIDAVKRDAGRGAHRGPHLIHALSNRGLGQA
jgi:uncharacterized protein YegP (UPF0339 family)